jgi:hypothetical protein
LFWSFSFGETVSPVSLLLSIILIPFVIYGLWQGIRTEPTWLPIVLVATGIAWLGASRFEPFVLMPSHLIFVLPFFLMLVVRKLNPMAFVALLALYAGADYAYFTRNGFLVKPYATPYKEMADIIRDKAREQNAIIAVDPWGVFAQPLLDHLDDGVRVVLLSEEASAREVLMAARSGSAILLWRRTSDVSPGRFVTKLEQDLSAGREVGYREFVAYSLPERWARRLLRGTGQPEYYYRLSEFGLRLRGYFPRASLVNRDGPPMRHPGCTRDDRPRVHVVSRFELTRHIKPTRDRPIDVSGRCADNL